MKDNAWIHDDNFIGVVGKKLCTLEDCARIIMHSSNAECILDALGYSNPVGSNEVVNALCSVPKEIIPMKMSVSEFYKEDWDHSNTYKISFKEPPGRGFVKVIGIHL